MINFSKIDDLKLLKSEYKKLAARYHPDKGGNSWMMRQLNLKYKQHSQQLKKKCRPTIAKFSDISVGDTVWVNGTESEVLQVAIDRFRVVAKGRNRQAIFDKQLGIGVFNNALFASKEYQPRPTC